MLYLSYSVVLAYRILLLQSTRIQDFHNIETNYLNFISTVYFPLSSSIGIIPCDLVPIEYKLYNIIIHSIYKRFAIGRVYTIGNCNWENWHTYIIMIYIFLIYYSFYSLSRYIYISIISSIIITHT